MPLENDSTPELGDIADDDENIKTNESTYLDIRNDSQIIEYYKDLYDDDPRVVRIKEAILGCKTLIEAQRVYLKMKDLLESVPSPNKGKKLHETIIQSQMNRQATSVIDRLKPAEWL